MVTVKPIPLDELNGQDLLPLAVLNCLPNDIEVEGEDGRRVPVRFTRECDDLGSYDIAAFTLAAPGTEPDPALWDALQSGPENARFALRRYEGAPPHTIDVLLPARLLGTPMLALMAKVIAARLGVAGDRVAWPKPVITPGPVAHRPAA